VLLIRLIVVKHQTPIFPADDFQLKHVDQEETQIGSRKDCWTNGDVTVGILDHFKEKLH
jgi:hypothetical protein